MKLSWKARLVTVLRFARDVLRELSRLDAFKSAAAVAFWLFLSLVPLFVFLGFVVGQVARHRGVDALLGPVLEVVPTASEKIVREEVDRLAGRNAAPVAPVSIAGYLWAASSGVHNLMSLFGAMVRAPRRAYWRQRLFAVGWVVAALAAACILATSIVRVSGGLRGERNGPAHSSAAAGDEVRHTQSLARGLDARRAPSHTHLASGPGEPATSRPRPEQDLATLSAEAFAGGAMLFVGTLFLAGFYRFCVSRPKHVQRRIWPGAFAAVGSWLVVSWAFGAYAASVADYALFYGSLAAVAVLLVWLYLTSLSLIAGAVVNALLEEDALRRRRTGKRAMSAV